MGKIFIYSLKHPITNEVRYIGKTVNIKQRYKQHIYDKRKTHKRSWIDSLLKENLKPVIEVLEICDDITWEDREIYWIAQFDNLTNHKPGGNGNSNYIRVTKEDTCKKISDILSGRKLSENHKDNIGKKLGFACIIDDVEYTSIQKAGYALGISDSTVKKRILSDDYPEYRFK